MGKNLNTIDRSERIRIGKNVPDNQAVNTIVINASNTVFTATQSGFYVSPIRYDTSVLSNTLVYNTVTNEIVDAGISADNQSLQDVTNYGNATSNTVEFRNSTTAFITTSNVGIINAFPIHTLDVGSNLYVDDVGSNILTVLGNVYFQQDLTVDGNLTVRGDSTLVHSENLIISDPIIVLGANNTNEEFIFDLGIVMSRPVSNVVVGYIENDDELVLAFTDSNPNGRTIEPDASKSLNVHVYGNITATSFFGDGTTLDGVALTTDFTSNVERIIVLETDLASNALRTGVLETDLASNVERIIVLETDLTSNASRTGVLETDLTSNTERIIVLEADLASNASRTGVLETDLTSNTERIIVLETDLASNASRTGVLEIDLSSNVERIIVLEADLASNASRAGVLETDLGSNTERIVVLETDLTSNTERIVVLETDLASNTERIVVLETDLASNASRTGVLETELTSNAARVGTLESEMLTKAPINNPVFTGIITGDGGKISNVTFEQVTSYGNTTSNTIYFTNVLTSIVTEGDVGIGTVAPEKKLHVAGDILVDANVYAVMYYGDGGLLSNTGIATLQKVTAGGATTDITIEFTNVVTGFVTTSNIVIGGNVTATSFFGDGTTLDGVALTTEFTSNVERIIVLEADLASNASRVGVLETDLASNVERIIVLETDLASNASRTGVLETDLASNTERIIVLEADLASNASRTGVLETDLASNTERIIVLEADLASNASRTGVLETDLASNTERIIVLETDLASNASRTGVLETDLASNTERIVVLEADLASNTERIVVLETDLASNTERIVVLETDLASNASRTGVLETDLTSNTARVGTLESEMLTKAPINNPVFTGIITGNGGKISNVTFEQVTSYGNTTSNTIYFTNSTTSLVTDLNSDVLINLNQLNDTDITGALNRQTIVYDGTNWNNQYLDQIVIYVKNPNDYGMNKGDVIFTSGSEGNNTLRVGLADASNVLAMPAIGMLYQNIDAGGYGIAVSYGRVDGVDTDPDVYASGQILYVSNTLPGSVTNIRPLALTDEIQNIGVVVHPHKTEGVAFVTTSGRSVDIPNAQIVTQPNLNYVYVNDTGNTLLKIEPGNLLTKLQTLEQVVNTANTVANVINVSGITIVSGDGFHGDLDVAGNVTVNTNTVKIDAESQRVGILTTTPGYTLDVWGNANVGALSATSAHILDSTVANDKTSGALRVAGGIGIEGNIHATNAVFDTIQDNNLTQKYIPYVNANKVFGDSYIRQETNGDIIIANDLQIVGNLYVQGNTSIVSANSLIISDRIIDIANNNTGHDLDIGILMEHPGHNIGIIHHANDELTIGYTQQGYGDDHILRDYSNEFTVNVWGYVITQNTITIEHNDLYVKSGLIGINTDSPDADLHVVGNAYISSNVIISDSTVATNKTSGALQVTGGVGIQGALFGSTASFNGITSITNTTSSTANTTGALVVTGGVGIQGALFGSTASFNGITSITNATDSTSITSGSLIITNGGLGVNSNIHATNVYASSNIFTENYLVHTGDVDTYMGFPSVNTIAFTTNGTEKMRIISSGGVGIGTDIPFSKLDVVGNAYITSNLTVGNSNLFVDTINGRVGIRTNTPEYTLDVHGTSNLGVLTVTSVSGDGSGLSQIQSSSVLNFDSNVARIGTLETDLTSNVARIVTLETDLTSNVARIVTLEDDLTSNVARIVTIESGDSTFSGIKTFSSTTQSTSTGTGAVVISGGLGVDSNIHASKLYLTDGLITNTSGVAKKTYSYSGTILQSAQPYINVHFTNHIFYAKITAQLVEGDEELSTLVLECGGGNKSGTPPSTDIAIGTKNIFGGSSTNPWNSIVIANPKRIALIPTTPLAVAGVYYIFIEYVSANPAGAVTTIDENITTVVTFGW